ncbi:MAG: hypothetical protein ABEJ62_02415 [Candidatus Nanohaloarchaea archaeon]
MEPRVLRREVDRNLEIAKSTKRMVGRERDMLQGDLQGRMVLHRFHTDVWDSMVNSGSLEEELPDSFYDVYMRLKEFNEIVDQFERHGNTTVHAPLLKQKLEGYGRKQLVGIIREKCDEIEMMLRDLEGDIEELAERTCPVCGDRFENVTGLKSHMKQVDDGKHGDYSLDL